VNFAGDLKTAHRMLGGFFLYISIVKDMSAEIFYKA
jgi:hypothetical protein